MSKPPCGSDKTLKANVKKSGNVYERKVVPLSCASCGKYDCKKRVGVGPRVTYSGGAPPSHEDPDKDDGLARLP